MVFTAIVSIVVVFTAISVIISTAIVIAIATATSITSITITTTAVHIVRPTVTQLICDQVGLHRSLLSQTLFLCFCRIVSKCRIILQALYQERIP